MPMGYDYLDWTDPLPAVKATTDFMRSSVRAVINGKLSRLREKPS